MAARQGSMDCLCGVYAVLNATELVVGRRLFNHKPKNKRSHKRALFAELIHFLAKKNKLKRAMTAGIVNIDARGGLIDVAIKSVQKRQLLTMMKQVAFEDDCQTLDAYLDKLHQHLLEANTAVIINITGRLEHWTCIKEITQDWLVLADSAGIKQLNRHQCNIGIEEKGIYSLWPSKTYLLSL